MLKLQFLKVWSPSVFSLNTFTVEFLEKKAFLQHDTTTTMFYNSDGSL